MASGRGEAPISTSRGAWRWPQSSASSRERWRSPSRSWRFCSRRGSSRSLSGQSEESSDGENEKEKPAYEEAVLFSLESLSALLADFADRIASSRLIQSGISNFLLTSMGITSPRRNVKALNDVGEETGQETGQKTGQGIGQETGQGTSPSH